MEEFVLPDFLQGTEEEIHDEMIRMAPTKTDTSEGALYWDHTRPTARVYDRLVSYELTLALMMKFPQFAVDYFLDLHGDPIGVYRHPAVSAVGEVTFSGEPGTLIPIGTVVTTIGDENEAAILFRVVNDGEIDESENLTLRVVAVEPGLSGMVPADTINAITEPIKGLAAISNEAATEGGTEREDDDSYRARILDRHRNKPLSGAKKDYVRWAKEVTGVGDVTVLPLWNGPKTVKVLVTNSDGQLASAELIAAVKQHIDPIDGMGEGVAPIGAVVTVDTLALVTVNIRVVLEIGEGYLLADVLQSIKKRVNVLLINKSIVKYTDIFSVITNTEGVADHRELRLNGSTSNLILGKGERAVVGEVISA